MKRSLVIAAVSIAMLTSAAGCGDNAGSGFDTGATTATTATTATGTVSEVPEYTFAVCGDNRAEGIYNGVLPRIIDSAKARGAAFVVDTGDVTGNASRDELRLYQNLTESSGINFYTVPGNHDVGAGGTSAAYTEIIGATHYSFDYGPDHFVIVDNADDKTGIDGAQMAWIESDLAANAGKQHQYIFAHIPVADPSLPSSHVTGEAGGAGLRSGQELVRQAGSYKNVSDYFFGHIHAYLAYRLAGTDAYVTGGAGAPLYFPENAGGYYHFLLVRVYPARVDVEVVRV